MLKDQVIYQIKPEYNCEESCSCNHFKYFLTEYNSLFRIDPLTGEIYCTDEISDFKYRKQETRLLIGLEDDIQKRKLPILFTINIYWQYESIKRQVHSRHKRSAQGSVVSAYSILVSNKV